MAKREYLSPKGGGKRIYQEKKKKDTRGGNQREKKVWALLEKRESEYWGKKEQTLLFQGKTRCPIQRKKTFLEGWKKKTTGLPIGDVCQKDFRSLQKGAKGKGKRQS